MWWPTSSKQFLLTERRRVWPKRSLLVLRKQIPVLFFWTGTHPDYHKPTDTFEKINYEDEARILNLVASIVRGLDE